MIVNELISELKELPQDLPVVVDYKELTNIEVSDSYYILTNSESGYSIGAAVVLE